MANFIQKFADAREYENAEHQYPNISLVEGEGLIWTAENPNKETILFNDSEIKWTLDDYIFDYAESGALNVDIEAVNNLYFALANPKDYGVSTSNAWYELNGTRYDANVTLKSGGDAKSDNVEFNIILSVATRSAAPQLYYTFTLSDYSQTTGRYENVVVEEMECSIAHWGLNYAIGAPSQDEAL